MSHVAIVLAAGLGTRMRSDIPKVAHTVAGRPLIRWVVDAVVATEPARTVVVLGHGAELVRPLLPPDVETCIQAEQLGTGHAVQVALEALGSVEEGPVLILPGDSPFVTSEILTDLVETQRRQGGVALLTTETDDPTGYGRIVRRDGEVRAIVEERDADAETRAITEVNGGVYCLDGRLLATRVERLRTDNAQGELYLTDVVGDSVASGTGVTAIQVPPHVVIGVNSQVQLSEVDRMARRAVVDGLMAAGVRVIDPDRVYVDVDAEVGPGAVLYPGVHVEGPSRIGSGAVVGPDVFLSDSVVGAGTRVWYAVLRSAEVGEDCEVGPFASLRPGTRMSNGSKVGTFVETKNAELGEGAKVPHLSYMGDATIGARANIGAGSITCNYDGYEKHRTEIGSEAFIGSDTMLVAPVRVGDRAVTGAGSTITGDVDDGDLAVERAQQRIIPGYAERRAARYRAARAEEGT